jgi:hypothetical protein
MKNPSVNTGTFISGTLGSLFLSEKSSAPWSETFLRSSMLEESSSREKNFRHTGTAGPVTFPIWATGFIVGPCNSVNIYATRIKLFK